MKEVGGDSVVVEEEEVVKAYRNLAGRGFFVEPSSAVASRATVSKLGTATFQRTTEL